ncbi:UNVERIFIED_CONTAM: hypothetical protein K2H54_011026 [Gekko kuhli]
MGGKTYHSIYSVRVDVIRGRNGDVPTESPPPPRLLFPLGWLCNLIRLPSRLFRKPLITEEQKCELNNNIESEHNIKASDSGMADDAFGISLDRKRPLSTPFLIDSG